MECKICGHEATLFSKAKILKKYDVSYYRCPNCGFIQTEEPYWLDEAYSDAIVDSDIGLISRNYNFAQKVASLLKLCFSWPSSCLDFGGGVWHFCSLNA